MKTLSYTVTLTQDEYLLDLSDGIGKIFALNQQYQELKDQGYQPYVTRFCDMKSDHIHISMKFDVDDAVATLILLKYPEYTITIEEEFESYGTAKIQKSHGTSGQPIL